jgi:xylulokinase
VGGGAKSRIWRQMVADMFAVPVVTPVETEAGALGAALQAMWCYHRQEEGPIGIAEICDAFIGLDPNGQAEPDAQTASQYRALYDRYRKTVDILHPLNSTGDLTERT